MQDESKVLRETGFGRLDLHVFQGVAHKTGFVAGNINISCLCQLLHREKSYSSHRQVVKMSAGLCAPPWAWR